MISKSMLIIICIASISLLSLSIMTGTAFTITTKLPPAVEISDPVTVCKTGVIKYTPLGAYPEGYYQVKAALAYCDSLA
ncbi:MAG: hypothetical protein WAQ29_00350 [Nitrososphaeraceae archaeon]